MPNGTSTFSHLVKGIATLRITLRTVAVSTILVATSLALSACTQTNGPLSTASPTAQPMQSMDIAPAPTGPLSIKPYCATGAGTCYSTGVVAGGEFKVHTLNFTRNTAYVTCATDPKDNQYTNWQPGSEFTLNGAICSKGTSDAKGNLPNWQWRPSQGTNGRPDMPGTYHLTTTELGTNRYIDFTLTIPSKRG